MNIRVLRRARTLLIDLRYGAILRGALPTRFAKAGAFETANSTYDDLRRLFRCAELTPTDVVVDVGCGKGRVLNWLLHAYRGLRIYGIEIDPEISASTARRLRRFHNVTVICGDATRSLPCEATVYYLYNPFDRTAMERFISTLGERQSGTPGQERRVLYHNATFIDLFATNPRFTVEEIRLPRSFTSALIRFQ